MMTTYQTLNDDYLQLEIYGQITGDEYVAVGFSTDRKMVCGKKYSQRYNL
jgi:hypothetical protein